MPLRAHWPLGSAPSHLSCLLLPEWPCHSVNVISYLSSDKWRTVPPGWSPTHEIPGLLKWNLFPIFKASFPVTHDHFPHPALLSIPLRTTHLHTHAHSPGHPTPPPALPLSLRGPPTALALSKQYISPGSVPCSDPTPSEVLATKVYLSHCCVLLGVLFVFRECYLPLCCAVHLKSMC